MPAGSPLEYRFERFRLLPAERRLLDDDTPVKLGSRAFDTLLVLVLERERAVPKAELMERVWPGVVVEENNLQVQIAALRKILGQEAIATIPGRGYQFTRPVRDAPDAAAPAPGRKTNLPRPLTTFVGREADVAACAGLLASTRLLTLTGIGGCGKTRLALRVAESVLPRFDDGACFVDLAPVADPERVPLVVATALGLREEAGRSIEDTLIRHLADREMLLVLDNCEHLLAACAALAERLLLRAAALRVLVTSREGLGISGEQTVTVRSLSVPAPATHDVETILLSESTRLFVDRARAAAPEFTFDEADADYLVEICRRLDGIPLALELAAARVRVLSLRQIHDRLNDRFRLLTGSARAMSRHQTLLATLQWSYEHLRPDEQQWLQRLSVFVGGWTLDAAAFVAGDTGDEAEALERLQRLVDQSLVLVERHAPDDPRYRMLETVRQYAQERLDESDQAAAVRERHVRYFVTLVKRMHPLFFTGEANRWYRRCDDELSNLLAAHAWCDHVPDGVNLGLELATYTRTYWVDRGLFALGESVYEESLARDAADRRSSQRARALFSFGQHQNFSGRFEDAAVKLEAALDIAREHGDEPYVVACLNKLAYARAYLGDIPAALACVEEELRIRRRNGEGQDLADTLVTKAAVCRMGGDFASAATALEQAYEQRDVKDIEMAHVIRIDHARVSIVLGALERARALLVEAIGLLPTTGSRYRMIMAVDVAGLLAAACGEWQRAAGLQSVFEAAISHMGDFTNPYDDRAVARLRAKPREMLGADAYAAAYEAGRRVTVEQALAETLAWANSLELK